MLTLTDQNHRPVAYFQNGLLFRPLRSSTETLRQGLKQAKVDESEVTGVITIPSSLTEDIEHGHLEAQALLNATFTLAGLSDGKTRLNHRSVTGPGR